MQDWECEACGLENLANSTANVYCNECGKNGFAFYTLDGIKLCRDCASRAGEIVICEYCHDDLDNYK